MIGLGKSQVQPIGLDIGHDAVKMLQVEVVGRSLSVRAACRRVFTDEAKAQPEVRLPLAVEMVRQMLREGGFAGRRVVACLPRSIVHVKAFRLPPMPVVELESAVQFEARSLFPFDVDDARVHCVPAGEVRQGNDVLQEVIVLAARNADVGDFVEQLHRCGVVIDSLDVEACALYRSVERFVRRREDEQDVYVLMDVGSAASHVVIGRGREISFLKTIDIGGMHLHDAVSKRLGISPGEAQALRRRLIEGREPGESSEKKDPVRQAVFDATRSVMEQLGRELSLCLRYQAVTFRGHRPTKVRLVGGESSDSQLQEVLNANLTIPVEAGKPLYNVDTSRMKGSEKRGTLGEWALALGLGLKRTEERFAPRDGRPRSAEALAAAEEGPEQAALATVEAAGQLVGTAPERRNAQEASHA